MKLTMRETAALAAYAITKGHPVEVVLTPGNGCRYSIVLTTAVALHRQDEREYASVWDGELRLLVALPDFGSCMVWSPSNGAPHPTYIDEKLPGVKFQGDRDVIAEFLGDVKGALDALAKGGE